MIELYTEWSGGSIDGLPQLRRWLDAMKARPACQRGIEVPFRVPNLTQDEKGAAQFAENARQSLQR